MKTIATTLLIIFVSLSAVAVNASTAKNYYQLYKEYKKKYEKSQKELKKVKKQRDDYGNQNESTYLDLVQCQRQLSGGNSWNND